MNGLRIVNIHKRFGETLALRGVSLEVQPGETVAVLGPSGCGKSTLLGIIAGLEAPDNGQVFWNGESLENKPTYQRGFGLMFQDFALFPHKNVFENVAFGLQMMHLSKDEVIQRVGEVLELVGLTGFQRQDVNTLSGEEQQRVALARSLAPQPRLLMLDEPLGSLDRTLRERLEMDLRFILTAARQTALYVTHDQQEAFTLANQVVLMNAGKVEQSGPPQELYRRPGSPFVARFLGLDNLLDGFARLNSYGSLVDTPIGMLQAAASAAGPVTVLLRPDGLRIDENGPAHLHGSLIEAAFQGSTLRAVIQVNGIAIRLQLPSNATLPLVGQPVQLSYDPREAVQIFTKAE